MDVVGGKTKKKYTMNVGDNGRTFVGDDGRALTEAQMKSLEGDWTQGQGNVVRYQDNGSILGGPSKIDDSKYNQSPASQPQSLGSLERRPQAPTPQPSPQQGSSAPAAPPTKTSFMMGPASAGDVAARLQERSMPPQQPPMNPQMLQQMASASFQPQMPQMPQQQMGMMGGQGGQGGQDMMGGQMPQGQGQGVPGMQGIDEQQLTPMMRALMAYLQQRA